MKTTFDKDKVLIFGLENEDNLASKVAEKLKTKISPLQIKKFSDGEWYLRLLETVRNKQIYIIASTCAPVNEKLMLLMILVDALRRDNAKCITAIIPYFGYARQDRRNNAREPIAAKLVADLLQTSGIDKAIFTDIHTDQLQGFFNFPTDNLSATTIILNQYIDDLINNNKNLKLKTSDFVLVSPDYGGVKRIRNIADKMNLNIAIVDKKRLDSNEVEIENVLGDVANKHCIVVDDIIDTAGTMVGACKLIKSKGAKSVTCICTHPVLTGKAHERLSEAFKEEWINDLYVSNSIKIKEEFLSLKKIHIVPLEDFFAKIILADQNYTSYYSVCQGYIDSFIDKINNLKKCKKKKLN